MKTIEAGLEKRLSKLSPVKKLEVADYLLKQIENPSEKILKAWALESEKRLTDFKNGKLKTHKYKFGKLH